MSTLYTYNAPIAIRDELMTSPRFYVPNTPHGVKTAGYLDFASAEEKNALFKEAAEDGDLSEALLRLQVKEEKAEKEREKEKEDAPDYGQNAFLMNDSDKDEEEEKDDEEEEKDDEEEEKDDEEGEKKEKDDEDEDEDDEEDDEEDEE